MNRLGRAAVVVIGPEVGGAHEVLFAAGPGARGSFSEGLAAFHFRQTLRIACGSVGIDAELCRRRHPHGQPLRGAVLPNVPTFTGSAEATVKTW